eukprot:9755633-Karenia_brevis.AAC.1
MTAIALPGNRLMLVANVYGWTNGHTCEESAMRTDHLLHIILAELSSYPDGPKLIVGDLNGDLDDFPSICQE